MPVYPEPPSVLFAGTLVKKKSENCRLGLYASFAQPGVLGGVFEGQIRGRTLSERHCLRMLEKLMVYASLSWLCLTSQFAPTILFLLHPL